MKLTKYEKETIILTSEGDNCYSIYTFNQPLKRKLAEFAKKYPEYCKLENSTAEGSVTYWVDKTRLSIHLTAPWSDERKNAMRDRAKKSGLVR
jgi:hypothetical protein